MIRKLAALAGGWLQDPYVCCTLGSLLLLRGLDTIAAQAKQLGEQLAQVQVQAQAAAAANGHDPRYPYDTVVGVQYNDGKLDPGEVPGADVAGEHEDLHP